MAWKAKEEIDVKTWLKTLEMLKKESTWTLHGNESYTKKKNSKQKKTKLFMHNNPFLIFMGWDASVFQE